MGYRSYEEVIVGNFCLGNCFFNDNFPHFCLSREEYVITY